MVVTAESIKKEIEVLVQRREVAIQSYHQIIGAISMLEQVAARLEAPDEPKEEDKAVL